MLALLTLLGNYDGSRCHPRHLPPIITMFVPYILNSAAS